MSILFDELPGATIYKPRRMKDPNVGSGRRILILNASRLSVEDRIQVVVQKMIEVAVERVITL